MKFTTRSKRCQHNLCKIYREKKTALLLFFKLIFRVQMPRDGSVARYFFAIRYLPIPNFLVHSTHPTPQCILPENIQCQTVCLYYYSLSQNHCHPQCIYTLQEAGHWFAISLRFDALFSSWTFIHYRPPFSLSLSDLWHSIHLTFH